MKNYSKLKTKLNIHIKEKILNLNDFIYKENQIATKKSIKIAFF